MARALDLGKEWLAKENPKFEGFRPSTITLECVSEGAGLQQWIWEVRYDARLGGKWLSGMGFEVYLLMDGSVVAPIVKHPE